METEPHGKVCRVRTQPRSKIAKDFFDALQAFTSKLPHDKWLIPIWDGSSTNSDIIDTERLNFEHVPLLCNLIQCPKDCFEKCKDLACVSNGTPLRKSGDFGK